MFSGTDLRLLADNIRQLSETPYFSAQLENYTKELLAVINHVVTSPGHYSDPILRRFTWSIWKAYRYLQGSISREIPYELEFCLRKAVAGWLSRPCVVTMALVDQKDFHFFPFDPWDNIKKTITGYKGAGFDALLIQVATPKLYKNKPLYNIPLFHELGHFVDSTLEIVKMSMLQSPPAKGTDPDTELSHRQEYFADLFAAAYVGRANGEVLQEIAGNHAASASHPATADRIALTQGFLAGKKEPRVDLFNNALAAQGAPPLSIKYKRPQITSCFDNIRPYKINGDEELYGIFEASWDYLIDVMNGKNSSWQGIDPPDAETIVNDLVEKSIRNASIISEWH